MRLYGTLQRCVGVSRDFVERSSVGRRESEKEIRERAK
jgi:hypothetical protein